MLGKREYEHVGTVFRRVEDEGDYATISADLWACPDCGSVAVDRGPHDRWHAQSDGSECATAGDG
jgi:hypothetical protein